MSKQHCKATGHEITNEQMTRVLSNMVTGKTTVPTSSTQFAPIIMQYYNTLSQIVAARFPNDSTLALLGPLSESTFANYSSYIQIAMGVATSFQNIIPDFSVEDMLGIVPTNPTLISMVTYVLNRMESMAAMQPTSNSPTNFNPILELNNTAARRVGVDFSLSFQGMAGCGSCLLTFASLWLINQKSIVVS
jgi:hypothetical protein